MSLRDLILAAEDLPVECVNVPEWGQAVYLKAMSGTVRAQWFDDWDKYKADHGLKDESDGSHFHAVALVHALSDEKGTLLFGMGDVAALRGKSPFVLKRLYDTFADQNHVRTEAVEDARKNS